MEEQLTIYIDQLRESPIHLEREITPESLDLDDEEYAFKAPVQVDVTFRLIGEADVIAFGCLKTSAETTCVRCLGLARIELESQVQETWVKEQPQDESKSEDIEDIPLLRAYEGESFDATEAFRELIMAELPGHPVCSSDCRGLCPGCGANLNTEPCRCETTGKTAETDTLEPTWKQSLKKIHLDK